jgi:hypothetical protein
LVQDFLREQPTLTKIPQPLSTDSRVLAISAALLELFAARLGQEAPVWTKNIGPLTEPIYLLASATHMKRLRELCYQESPEPLRQRGFYAPPNYLEFA